MPDCTFTTIAPDLHRCQRCGVTLRSSFAPGRIHRRCMGTKQLAPAERLARDIEALLLNQQVGVSAVEIERRLTICRACESWKDPGCQEIINDCPSAAYQQWLDILAAVGKCQRVPCEQWECGRPARIDAPATQPTA